MLLRNTSLYFVGELVNRIGKLGAMYLVASVISKTDFGNYSYLLSICLIVIVFLDFGMNTLVMLRTSWKRFEHLLPFFFAGKLVTIAAVGGALTMYDLRYGFFGGAGVLAPFLLLCIGWDAAAFLGNVLRTRLNFIGEFWIKLIANCGFLFLLVSARVAHFEMNAVQALWLQALAFVPACLLGLGLALRGIRRPLPDLRHLRRGLLAIGRIGAPMSLAASVGVVQPSVDSLVLGASHHMEVNASFTLVNRLGLIVQMPVNVVMFSALPYLVQRLREGFRLDAAILRTLVLILVLCGVAVAHLFALVVEWIIPAALGKAYLDARFFGGILALYIIPYYVYPLYSNMLAALRHVVFNQFILAVCTLAGAVVDVIVIRRYGPYAVAFVNVSFNWILFTVFCSYYRKALGTWPISRTSLSAMLIGTASVAAPLLLPAASFPEGICRAIFVVIALCAAGLCLLKNRTQLQSLSEAR